MAIPSIAFCTLEPTDIGIPSSNVTVTPKSSQNITCDSYVLSLGDTIVFTKSSESYPYVVGGQNDQIKQEAPQLHLSLATINPGISLRGLTSHRLYLANASRAAQNKDLINLQRNIRSIYDAQRAKARYPRPLQSCSSVRG